MSGEIKPSHVQHHGVNVRFGGGMSGVTSSGIVFWIGVIKTISCEARPEIPLIVSRASQDQRSRMTKYHMPPV